MKIVPSKVAVGSLALILGMTASQAAQVSLTASDANGAVTSLNGAGKWSNGQAPNATNDYFTSAFFLRSPNVTSGGISYTFQGNSLTLQPPSGQGAPMRSFLFKGGANDVITINNLTNAAGGVYNQGGAGSVSYTTTGNLWTIAGNSTVLIDQGPLIVGYPLAGADGVVFTNAGGNTVTYNNSLSGFTGKFFITRNNNNGGGGNTTVILASGSSNLGNPSTPTPDQITICGNTTFEDNAGLTFGNSNGGITLLSLSGFANATINVGSTTVISEPITDTNNGVSTVCSLTAAGSGTLVLSNANNSYNGGTTVSSGTLRLGVDNAIPGGAFLGDVTITGALDLNSHNEALNGFNGAGTVMNSGTGTPVLTMGANGDNGTFTGSISGSLGITKEGAGTQSLISANCSFSGPLSVSNATLALDNSAGTAMSVGSLAFLGNAGLNINFGTILANPANPAIVASGGISATGGTVLITVAATGLKTGTFTLIKYGSGTADLSNFQLSPPPGVAATLVNNTGNQSIDIQITATPNQLAWNGVNGTSWDLTTANWTNLTSGGITVFQQYTNGSVVAGDSVLFDDTLTNDSVNPQPTNIVLNSRLYAFPVVFNSSLPYTLSGSGGILGVTSLVKSNAGSLTLLTSNSFSGGVDVEGGTLIVTNDSALGVASTRLTLDGVTFQVNGSTTNNRPISMPATSTIDVGAGATVGLAGVINGGSSTLNKTDAGTLVLTAHEAFTGDLFLHGGITIFDTGGSLTNGNYNDVGQSGTDSATLTIRGNAALSTTSDFNLGDLDSSSGTLNISGSATLTVNQLFVASANAAGSTASGVVNQSGGTVTEVSTAVGAFAIGGRTSPSAVGVYNMSGGTLNAFAGMRVGGFGVGTLNQSGGTINARQGINIARQPGSIGTNNLNGGVLSTFNVASSTGVNAIFNFNGGTLQANFSPASPWMSGLSQANILAGGAFIDSSNNTVNITQPLLAGSANGGLTKLGNGTLTLSGVNTFTGPITNNAGTLVLNSASSYPGAAVVNAGVLQLNSATLLNGPTVVNSSAALALVETGSSQVAIGNVTLNGAGSGTGATLSLTPGSGYNPATPLATCTTLTLNGTNTINVVAANPGTNALLQYTTLAGSGNCTNLLLPQGATGYISNDVANSTLYVIVTSAGPGLVWTGTNTTSPNLWDINNTTNWLVNSTPTSYHQIVSPGDAVIFNDVGSGSVTLNTSASPSSMVISNNAKTYTFSGTGGVSGAAGILKLGTGTAVLNLTNDTYTGDTTVSNGILQVANTGTAQPLSANANLVIASGGTLQLSSQLANATTSVGEFTGSGAIHYTGGINSILSFGGSANGTWAGTIYDDNGGGLSLTKSGTGTWVVSGTNHLDNSDFFNAVSQQQINGGTLIITNTGVIGVGQTEFWVAQGAGSTASVFVNGGTLVVSNDWLAVGRGDATANGTLVVNSGTVQKLGANSLVVGSTGATGTLIVNGGQVLDNSEFLLGEGPTSIANFYLNGGLVQTTDIRENNNGGLPTVNSVAYFNGGTLQADTNTSDFLQVVSMVMSNGLVLDDGGWNVSIVSAALQPGDTFNGGLVKKGAGTLYLDSANTYTGSTTVANGTLGGGGSVSGPLAVGPAGNIAPGDAVTTAGNLFTINGDLTLQGSATFRISVTGSSPANDQIVGVATANYGGTLVVTNVTSDATVLTNGQAFQLFSATTGTGNFAHIVGSPGAGLSYVFNPSTGVLSVTNVVAKSVPHITTIHLSGTTLTISGTNGTPSGQFTLLGSTNVALPVLQWTPLLTNQFNPDGTFNLTTNIVNPGVPIEFYLLSQ